MQVAAPAAEPASNAQDIDRVIEGGFCVGCGLCAALKPQDFAVGPDAFAVVQARALRPTAEREEDISAFCPMSGAGPNETELGNRRFGDLPFDDRVGHYEFCGLGWVSDEAERLRCSSGGFLSWVSGQLLERGLVDEIIHVSPNRSGEADPLFRYDVSSDAETVLRSAKSRYYPADLVAAVAHMQAHDKRFAFMGLPCSVKAVTALMEQDPILKERIKFTMALICGHLKSQRFAELLAWQVGVEPERLQSFDFRKKIKGQPAHSYGIEAVSNDDPPVRIEAPMRGLMGKDWGQGLLKCPACEFCDDIVGECGDLSVGDGWISPYRYDWRGTNVFVSRSPEITQILKDGVAAKRVRIDPCGVDEVAQTQSGSYRHRRDGLSWRLAQLASAGRWAPKKRVPANANALSPKRQAIMEMRSKLLVESHEAFAEARAQGNLDSFRERMRPLLRQYAALNKVSKLQSLQKKLRNGVAYLHAIVRFRVLGAG